MENIYKYVKGGNYMFVTLINAAGVSKRVKVGFSWTTFFFGFIPALIRGDLKWAIIMFVLTIIIGTLTIGFGAWIPGIIFCFIYNKIYIKELLEKGYGPADEQSKSVLIEQQVIVA